MAKPAKHETTLPLDDRVAAALTSDATSATVAALLQECDAASTSINEAALRAHTRAHDPTLSAHDVRAARDEMENASFAADRLQVAMVKLKERHDELRKAEENARRRAAYDQAAATRDALAAELKDL